MGAIPSPGQQLSETVDRVPADHPGQHILKVSAGLHPVELACLDQGAEDRPAGTAAIAAGEQMVLAAERDRADRPLNRVGVEFDPAVMQEPSEARPAAQRITYGFGKRAVCRHPQKLAFQPGLHAVHNEPGPCPTRRQAMLWRLAPDILLNGVKLTNPPQRLRRQRRAGCLFNLIELASGMRPTCRENNISADRQPLKAGIAINVEDALEPTEVRSWSLCFAIWREDIDRCRRRRATPTSLIAGIHP